MTPNQVIKKPLLTEKSNILYHDQNQVVLVVNKKANKHQIKESLEQSFAVKVQDVRTINVQGKKKRLGRNMGKRSDIKKAIVQLEEGSKIDYFEGA